MILLDTHVLVWWVSDKKKLSRIAYAAMSDALKHDGFAVSAISIWELAMLLNKGRLAVTIHPQTWLDRVEATKGLHLVPVDSTIARSSVALPGTIHDDPADRMIIATARNLGIPLVTVDKKIRNYPHVQTIWYRDTSPIRR